MTEQEKTLTYDREVQCNIIDTSMLKYLKTIQEEEEHDAEGREFNAMMDSPIKPRTYSVKKDRDSLKGSFIQPVLETEEQRREREHKEAMEKFRVLSKDEAKEAMTSKVFAEFLGKTSRIMERALDQDDVIGDFFAEDDEVVENRTRGEKLTQGFAFQPNVAVKRAVTSMDWSPKHTELMLVSYSKCSEYRYDEPDGLVNVFSCNLKTRPEVSLTC